MENTITIPPKYKGYKWPILSMVLNNYTPSSKRLLKERIAEKMGVSVRRVEQIIYAPKDSPTELDETREAIFKDVLGLSTLC